MLQMIIKSIFNKRTKGSKKFYAEDIVWKNEVYPVYIVVRNKFIYCMQHKLLKRQDILNFKLILNNYTNEEKYFRTNFQNDCHEIYTKLKDTKISKKQMTNLNRYLEKFISQT